MKIKYLYQQLASHIGVILVAFLILSLLFSHYVEKFVYESKTEELATYGENILIDITRNPRLSNSILHQYENVLGGRDIQYSLFNDRSEITYSTGLKTPLIELTEDEWKSIQSGHIVTVKQAFDRFDDDVTFVLLPHIQQNQFQGGILLTSPIKGSRQVVTQMNQYLIYTTAIALGIALLFSWLASLLHVRRIKQLREATSLVAAGDYSVHIPSTHFDEISDLANDFNSMVKKLHQSMEEIATLENRRRQFMADVSHELRTPLTTIRGIIEGMNNDMISEQEKAKGLALASNETRRLIRLVNENLDYEKIRSNQIELHKQPIQLHELFEILKEQLYDMAAEKNNQIIIQGDPSTIVYADYDRLTQVCINIAKNSIQFTEDGTITLRCFTRGNEVIIEISDTGVGIDPEHIEKIWRRFYKAIVSRTNNPYGEFGLGLSIVKQLVTMHDGHIYVTSEKGHGTTFHITLPQHS